MPKISDISCLLNTDTIIFRQVTSATKRQPETQRNGKHEICDTNKEGRCVLSCVGGWFGIHCLH